MNVMRSGGAQGHVNHTQLVHIPEAHGKNSHSNCHLCMKSVTKSQLYYLHTTAIFPMALNY